MVKCKYDPAFVVGCMSVNSFPKYNQVHSSCVDCLHFRAMVHCLRCDCWDSDREGCTMPESDRWYACPIESARPENIAALEAWCAFLDQHRKEVNNESK